MALAGRAGEELVYGREEMSSLHQSRNMLARQIATKMQNAGEGERGGGGGEGEGFGEGRAGEGARERDKCREGEGECEGGRSTGIGRSPLRRSVRGRGTGLSPRWPVPPLKGQGVCGPWDWAWPFRFLSTSFRSNFPPPPPSPPLSGMSDHPDFNNLRSLGTTWYDPSSEPGRWQSYTVITDQNQSRSEWIDMDMEMEARLGGAYEEAKALIARNR